MKKIYTYIDKQKYKDNNIIIIVRFFYLVLSNQILVGASNVIVPFAFSLYIKSNTERFGLHITLCIIGLAVLNFLHGVAVDYKLHSRKIHHAHQITVKNIETIYKTFNERITMEKTFDDLFQMISGAVCQDVYHLFKNVFSLETRISVVLQYFDAEDDCFYSAMAGRTSKKTHQLAAYKGKAVVEYSKSSGRYYNKILQNNTDEIIVLDKEKIKKYFHFNHKPKKSARINQYICIPQKAYGVQTAFLLQIDVMENGSIHKTKEEIEDFCEEYIDPYMRTLQNAYIVENLNIYDQKEKTTCVIQ